MARGISEVGNSCVLDYISPSWASERNKHTGIANKPFHRLMHITELIISCLSLPSSIRLINALNDATSAEHAIGGQKVNLASTESETNH